MRLAVVPFVATRLPLVLAGVLSVAMLPVSSYVPSYWLIKGLDRAVDAFSRWDAWHYSRIAVSGYPPDDPSRAAFFPLFPALMRLLGELVGRTDRVGMFAAGVAVANVCLLLATMVLIALARLELGEDDARRAAWYLLAFPTSLFLSAGAAGVPDIGRWHAIRKSVITEVAKRHGVEAASRFAGHSSTRVTWNHYVDESLLEDRSLTDTLPTFRIDPGQSIAS
mgnify:CR=1 FL=1